LKIAHWFWCGTGYWYNIEQQWPAATLGWPTPLLFNAAAVRLAAHVWLKYCGTPWLGVKINTPQLTE